MKTRKQKETETRTVQYDVEYEFETSEGSITYYDEGFGRLKDARESLDRIMRRCSLDDDRERYRNFRIVRHEIVDREKVVKTVKGL